MPSLTLYTYWRSSSAYRVRIALAVKNVPYEKVAVNLLASEQTRSAYLEMCPTAHVPCLVVDGKPLGESVAIIELLEELFPSPQLFPMDPWARAQVRSLVEIINAGTQPMQNLHVLQRVSDDKEARATWARHFIGRGLAAFEAVMARHHAEGTRGKFAYGDALTAADCVLVPQVYNAKRFDLDLGPMPRVAAAYDAALATAQVASAMPERQPDASP
jgi:maleylpyruvate isomerase